MRTTTIRLALGSALLSSAIAMPAPALAQASIDWVQYPGGLSIALDAAHNVYTVDYDYNPGGDISLTKRDTDGNLLWVESYDNTDPTRFESATWVETDGQGNVIVIGDVNSGFSNPVKAASIAMKYGPDGNLLWRVVYEGSFDGSYTRKCLVDGEGNIYVLGTGNGPAGYVTKVKKFAPDGAALWSWFDGAGIGLPTNFKFTPDGGIVIAARSVYGSVNGYAKIDGQGQTLWSHPGVPSLTVGDAAGDASGNSYLVHGEYVVDPGTVLKKLSPTGVLLWESVYDLAGFRVDVGGDNHAVVSGFPGPGTPGSSFIKVDAGGNLLWSNPDADGALGLMLHAMMKIDASGDIYLAAGTLFEMAVCKVKSDGTSAWTMTMPGGYARAFALGNDGSVYVAGGATVKLTQATQGQPPVVSDIPDQTVAAGGRFKPIKVDNYVSDPDTADAEISWTWSRSPSLVLTWYPARRLIGVRPRVAGWTGSETVTFTATDPEGLSDSDVATFTVLPGGADTVLSPSR